MLFFYAFSPPPDHLFDVCSFLRRELTLPRFFEVLYLTPYRLLQTQALKMQYLAM